MKKLIIVSEQKSFMKRPLSHDAILGQERAFLEHGKQNVEIRYISFFIKGINRIIKRAGMKPIIDPFAFAKREDSVYLYIAMHINYLRSNLALLKRIQKSGNRLALYVWDCWEPEYEEWEKVLDELRPDYIFFSFKQNLDHFKKIYENSYWVAQSANQYYFKDLGLKKERLFIQMGRVNKPLHEKILAYLEKKGLEDNDGNYVYRRREKEALFPDLNDLVREINRSKYIVCIPKIYESPHKTGNICAMTGRYYESILCKTLIIGKKPLVFDELFPEGGMIEFKEDLSDFDARIDDLEEHKEKYRSIVEKNYEWFLGHHTWGHRLDQIMDIINKD